MNAKQIISAVLLLVVALSLGALVWQKNQPGRSEATGFGSDGVAVEEGVQVSGELSVDGEAGPAPVPPSDEKGSPPAGAAAAAPAKGSLATGNAASTKPAANLAEGTDALPASASRKAEPVQALYLHGTFRCETCNSIEDQAKRSISEDFAAQIQAGELRFASLNIDKEPHVHYVEDFQLTSTSLVLTDGRGPKGRWKVLERTWELVKDPVAFRDYVGTETRAFLAAAGGR